MGRRQHDVISPIQQQRAGFVTHPVCEVFRKAVAGKKGVAARIALRLLCFEVLPAVDLDDETCGVADEIHDIWTNRSLAAKARALLAGRPNVSFEDIRALLLPSLRHRLILNLEADAEGVTAEKILTEVAGQIPEVE